MWKDRYLILKGAHLYVLKSPNEEKIKAWINLSGYKFISDGSVGGIGERNKYGFKAIHETQSTHYFSSADSVTTRNWMKALIKATIERDYTSPVTSSSNIKTIPLSVAQAMNPPPRPPSPTSARNMQKARLQQNPNVLSAQDAAKLMGASIVPSDILSSGEAVSASQTGNLNGASTEQSETTSASPTNSPSRRRGLRSPLRNSQRRKPISEGSSVADRRPVCLSRLMDRVLH